MRDKFTMSNNVASDDLTIIVDSRPYSILEPPTYEDPLVQRKVDDILQTIDLEELTDNLTMAVELFWVSYCGVAGARTDHGSLQAEIAMIQTEMAKVCNDCVLTLMEFQRASRDIIRNITRSYKWLLRTKEPLAIKTLARCGVVAKNLADEAERLARSFGDLQERTTNVHIKTIGARQDQHERVLEFQRQLDETKRVLATQEIERDEIAAQVSKVSKLRMKAEKREEDEAKRAQVTQIVGAIAGALGAGLSAATQVATARYGGIGLAAANATQAVAQNGQGQPAAKQQPTVAEQAQAQQARKAKVDLALARKKSAELTEEIADLKKEIADFKTKIADAENGRWTPHATPTPDDSTAKQAAASGPAGVGGATARRRPLPPTPVELDEHLDALRGDLAASEKDLAAVEKEKVVTDADVARLDKDTTTRDAAMAGVASGLDNVAQSTNQMSAQAEAARKEFAQQSMQLLEQEFKLEDKKRQALIKIREAAMKIESLDVEHGAAEVSEEALGAAIGALGRIVDLLLVASRFWYQLAAECESLSNADLVTTVQDLADPEMGLSPEERLEEYRDQFFVQDWLHYVCRWIALQGLTRTYLVKATEASERAGETLGDTGLSINEALRKAPDLARHMQLSITERLEESKVTSDEIKKFMDEMAVQAELPAGDIIDLSNDSNNSNNSEKVGAV